MKNLVLAASITFNVVLIGIAVIFKVFIFDEATSYAKGFSENNFRKLHCGMNVAEITSVIGYPLKVTVRETGTNRRIYSCGSRSCFDESIKHLESKTGEHDSEAELVYSAQSTPTSNYNYRVVIIDSRLQFSRTASGYYVD